MVECEKGCQEAMIGPGSEDVRTLFLFWEGLKGEMRWGLYLRLRARVPHPGLVLLAIQVPMLVHLDDLMENAVLTFGIE